MNDQGLFVDGNALAPTGWKADPNKPMIAGNVMMIILATCATCEDVKALFEKFNSPDSRFYSNVRPRVSGIQTHIRAASKNAPDARRKATLNPCLWASDPMASGAMADAILPML